MLSFLYLQHLLLCYLNFRSCIVWIFCPCRSLAILVVNFVVVNCLLTINDLVRSIFHWFILWAERAGKFYLLGHSLMFRPPYMCFRKEGQFLMYSHVLHIHLLWSLLLPQLLLSAPWLPGLQLRYLFKTQIKLFLCEHLLSTFLIFASSFLALLSLHFKNFKLYLMLLGKTNTTLNNNSSERFTKDAPCKMLKTMQITLFGSLIVPGLIFFFRLFYIGFVVACGSQ